MLLSKLGGKEIVNLSDGGRLGVLAESELLIYPKNGKIKSILVPDTRSQFMLFNDRNYLEIPWDSIRKIGNDMIIIELEDEKYYRKKYSF